jgi:hypothetical protein
MLVCLALGTEQNMHSGQHLKSAVRFANAVILANLFDTFAVLVHKGSIAGIEARGGLLLLFVGRVDQAC